MNREKIANDNAANKAILFRLRKKSTFNSC